MDDKAFGELQIAAMIAPSSVKWPTDLVHWQRIHAAVTEARTRVKAAYQLMAKIDDDPDLSFEGRARQKRKIAAQAVADLNASQSLDQARKAVNEQVERWEAKSGLVVKPAADAAEAVLYWEIRDKFAGLKDETARMSFLERFATDPQIAAALVHGPAGLANLSDGERAMLRAKVDAHVPTEIREARSATVKALSETEAGWSRAIDNVAQRGGLTKDRDGGWVITTQHSNAARAHPLPCGHRRGDGLILSACVGCEVCNTRPARQLRSLFLITESLSHVAV
jgi:hypothetical protein